MKINISILSSREIMLKEIIPLKYWNLINENFFSISSTKSISDWISIEQIQHEIAILDYSNVELDLICEQIGTNFSTILVTLKREFANSIFDMVVNKLKTIKNNTIMMVVYSSPIKILKFNEYIILYNKGLGIE